MPLSRRALALASIAAAVPLHAAAQATPDASPVAITDPEEVFALLRDTPFSSLLLPAGYDDPTVTIWDDSGDTDLEGVVGGLLVGLGAADEENFFGVMIVHPDAAMARERLDTLTDQPLTFFGIEGSTIIDMDEEFGYASAAIVLGPVIVSAAADVDMYPDDYVARCMTHLVAMIDHVQRVTGLQAEMPA